MLNRIRVLCMLFLRRGGKVFMECRFLKKLEKKPTAEDQPAIKQDILFEFPGLGIGLGDFFILTKGYPVS